jgi:hypothetical protein
MGLDINMVLMMIDARKRGVILGETLTIGRQHLNVYPAKMAQILERNSLPSENYRPGAAVSEFGEPCLKAIGASRVYSLDASDFEGADFVHDLNKPLPEHLANRFDTVFDGGTLEHVFNFPVSIRNCMDMLRVNGRFFMHTCANNLCGHGFYQFSPELIYRIFSPDNGFEVERVILHRIGPYNRWYEVPDPNSIRSRIELITFTPIQMMVQARKTRQVEVFATAPQQSDYTALWSESAASGSGPIKPSSAKVTFQRWFPGLARVLHVIRMGILFYSTQSLFNRRAFRPVPKP